MIKLSDSQQEELTHILSTALGNIDELRLRVSFVLGTELHLITESKHILYATFDVVKWANREGLIKKLVDGMSKAKPHVEDLKQFAESLSTAIEERADATANEPREAGEDITGDRVVTGAGRLDEAGIESFTSNFNKGIPWEELFAGTSKLDIFFTYGRTWRHTYREELHALIERSPAITIRVVLPDPDHALTTKLLAEHFQYTDDEIKNYIRDAIIFFQNLRERAASNQRGASIGIWLLSAVPQFSFYSFDNRAVLAWFSNRRVMVSVPAIIVRQGGKLYSFIEEEFNAMITGEQGVSKRLV